ncbi:unnamed protein product [Rotaria sp. Silwood2]|nr:unnamed protein product [Rotaria sp. Silwood2]CAF4315957.1 unnamed protein product [Rotaria sp. Silwood2]
MISGQNAEYSSLASCGCCPSPGCSAKAMPCSSNGDCECLLMTMTGSGMCADTIISCSNLTRCERDNETCLTLNTVCVNNTRCNVPVCYPIERASFIVCPSLNSRYSSTTPSSKIFHILFYFSICVTFIKSTDSISSAGSTSSTSSSSTTSRSTSISTSSTSLTSSTTSRSTSTLISSTTSTSSTSRTTLSANGSGNSSFLIKGYNSIICNTHIKMKHRQFLKEQL